MCPNKHGNSKTNSRSSLLRNSILIHDFKSHSIIMSARVYFMKMVNGCKDVLIMSPQDDVCILRGKSGGHKPQHVPLHASYYLFCLLVARWATTVRSSIPQRMQSKHKQTNCKHKITDYSFLSRYRYIKLKNYLKRRYCNRHNLLGHPVLETQNFLFFTTAL